MFYIVVQTNEFSEKYHCCIFVNCFLSCGQNRLDAMSNYVYLGCFLMSSNWPTTCETLVWIILNATSSSPKTSCLQFNFKSFCLHKVMRDKHNLWPYNGGSRKCILVFILLFYIPSHQLYNRLAVNNKIFSYLWLKWNYQINKFMI